MTDAPGVSPGLRVGVGGGVQGLAAGRGGAVVGLFAGTVRERGAGELRG